MVKETRLDMSLTLQHGLIPVEVRRFKEILSVEVEALSEAQQLAQFLDECTSAHTGLPCLLEGQREG